MWRRELGPFNTGEMDVDPRPFSSALQPLCVWRTIRKYFAANTSKEAHLAAGNNVSLAAAWLKPFLRQWRGEKKKERPLRTCCSFSSWGCCELYSVEKRPVFSLSTAPLATAWKNASVEAILNQALKPNQDSRPKTPEYFCPCFFFFALSSTGNWSTSFYAASVVMDTTSFLSIQTVFVSSLGCAWSVSAEEVQSAVSSLLRRCNRQCPLCCWATSKGLFNREEVLYLVV